MIIVVIGLVLFIYACQLIVIFEAWMSGRDSTKREIIITLIPLGFVYLIFKWFMTLEWSEQG